MRFSSGERLTAAPLLLFHRRLKMRTHAQCVRALFQTELKSEQTRGREAFPHPQTERQPGDWRAAAWSSWTLSLLFLRDSPFKERFTVVDAASKPTLKQLGYSMRARAEMCLLLARARRESACDRCALTAFCWELRSDCRLIDLVSSSSLDDTASLLAESDVLTWSISTVPPLSQITSNHVKSRQCLLRALCQTPPARQTRPSLPALRACSRRGSASVCRPSR